MANVRKPSLFVATRTGWLGNTLVREGDTIVAGHPLLERYGDRFRPFTPTFDLPRGSRGAERAVARAGETRTPPAMPAPADEPPADPGADA